MIAIVGWMLHEFWILMRVPIGGAALIRLGLVAVLGLLTVVLVFRLVGLILRLAVRGLLVGVPLVVLAGYIVYASEQPFPITSKSALELAQRAGVAAYHAVATHFTLARLANLGQLVNTDEEALIPQRAFVASAASDQPTAWVVVGHTDGEGVYLRATPQMADRLHAWADGTRLEVVGEDTSRDGHRWKRVRDPGGHLGWVPADFVVPTSEP
jgi:hypothetical protein